MIDLDVFLNSSLEDIRRGYKEKEESYVCLFCEQVIEKGIVYKRDELFYEAERYMKVHIEKSHQSVFDYLIGLDKKVTGLSDHQKALLKLFYQGKSDLEVQKEMGIGSSSTIRNHRFVLKEKERQSKIYLVLMELMKGRDKKTGVIPPHKTAKMLDDRYNVTDIEYEKIVNRYFPQGIKGPLKTFHMKEKSKLVVLREIAKRFEDGRIYTEKEVNAILKTAYEDFVTLRRYLIEYGFLDRKPDGGQYWLKGDKGVKEAEKMHRKQELKQQYKEMKVEAGVYQIKNNVNQKVLVIATPNLKTINGKIMELRSGGYRNEQLQAEWNQYGESAFKFEVLEVLEEKEEGFFDKDDELKKLENKWLDKLKPYGDRGYNKDKRSRS